MKLELALRYQPQPQRPVTAWYFPSPDTAEWLRVLCRSGWDQAALRCVPIPRSRTDLAPRGVLFVTVEFAKPSGTRGVKATQATLPWNIDRRLQPFGELHARCYLPVEAALNAALAPEEFADLHADADSLLVWLPDLGLIALAADDALRVADLLQAPPCTGAAWTFAEPASALNTRLLSLQPWDPPTLENFRQTVQDDIGSQADKAADLPPSPREAAPGVVAGASRALTLGIAGAVTTTAGMLDKLKQFFASGANPENASGAAQPQPQKQSPSLLERARQWAAQTQQRITDSVSAARDRELTRLLGLLKNNPDEGLRYAIPLAGDAPRGVAPPGSQLTVRDINFRAGGAGSGPSDYWEIAEQNRRALIAKYRDLANREIALGRHRRAAYIFAELLGDYGAAAQTLADGQHHREAALLYEERLKNPRQAAKCLDQGGLLTEAIAIYQRLGEHETVGDLYHRLEQQDSAAAAYERAILELLISDNYLRAAELCEKKLENIERAIETLEQGWHRSTSQRQSCFLRSFVLLAQTAQHERARTYLDRIIRQVAETADIATFAPDLATVATTYPDAPLRAHGKDQTRLLIGRHLSITPTGSQRAWEQQTLLQTLGKLEPGDRLLARDTRRYESNLARTQTAFPVDKGRAVVARGRILQLDQTQLPCDHCQAMTSHANNYYIAGLRGETRIFFRADHLGHVHYPTGKPERVVGGQKNSIQMHWNTAGREKILILPYQGEFADRTFPATDRFPEEVTIGTGSLIDETTVAVAYNGSQAVTCLNQVNYTTFSLNHHADPSGRLQKSHPIFLDTDAEDDTGLSFQIHTYFEHWFIGFLRQLWIGQGSRDPREIQLPGILCGFIAAPANSLFRLVALLDEGIFLTWGYLTNLHHTKAAAELAQPVGCFTLKGELILAGTNGIEVYSTDHSGLKMIAELKSLALRPIGVMSIEGTKRFIVVQEDGLAITYQWK